MLNLEKVAIFGVPRSGTSWLGQIYNSSPNVAYRYQPIFAYSFDGFLSEDSSSKDIQEFYEELLSTDDSFVCQTKNISGNTTPDFEKEKITHLVWKEVRYLNIIENLIQQSSTKVIGIIRHPCGVLKSWMKAPKEFNEEWDIEEQWQYADKKNKRIHEFYGFEQWIHATEMFRKLETQYPDQFKPVVYETLLEDPASIIEELFNFSGLRYTDQTKSFLIESTRTASDDPYDVYRKEKSGQEWRNELPPSIINEVLHDERFVKLSEYFELEISKS
ncbi:hypothetical protein CK503_13515 [Aliifodinibius salipaludis]|uniref:Sulfotransferase domain-containing protein n=1 Tax=Fodinibius salipaludis TaxID=2032627 RepID=A0A2A2G8L4_9BACT|nr:sulfotransferase domain-containing protein [Aliifodinibius salipaludis]PAU93172.1 hypothetical protein CK503_13515 [Aliifodinibius salipaludis]